MLKLLLPAATGGGDSEIYRRLAVHPFEPITIYKNAVFQFRILVPAIVWLLPVPTDTGFHVVTSIGVVAGAVLVALLARAVGLNRVALLAAPLSVLSFYGFYGLSQFRMIDSVAVSVFAAALLAALAGAAGWCSLLSVVATAAKEVGVLIPLAFYAARASRLLDRRVLRTTILIALPAVALFVALRLLLPHGASYRAGDVVGGWYEGLSVQGRWGYPKVLLQVLLQNFGLLWLLWPLGVAVAPVRWRRLHCFLLVLLPVLVGTHWSRSASYLLPFVLPSALLVLARSRLPLTLAALGGSTWVAVLMSLRNIAVEPPGFLATNAALVPGVLLFAVAAAPAAWSSFRDVVARAPRVGVARSKPAA
jgi:hypothetical protein